jgi:hypothetical protein
MMSIRCTASKLAKLLGVSQAAVSGAAINNHLCQEYPVAGWADKSERGRIRGFNVPDDVFDEIAAEGKQEKNQAKGANTFGLYDLLARYYPEEASQKEGYMTEEEDAKYVAMTFKNALADESLPKEHRIDIARAFEILHKEHLKVTENRTNEEIEAEEDYRFIKNYIRDAQRSSPDDEQ